MTISIVICVIACILMIAGILFFPKIKIGKLSVDTYWVVALAGALSLVICGQNDFVSIGKKLAENSAVNPFGVS